MKNRTRYKPSQLLLLILIGLVGSIAGLVVNGFASTHGAMQPSGAGETGLVRIKAKSIHDLNQWSDVIVIATIGRVVNQGKFLYYDDQSGAMIKPPEPPTPVPTPWYPISFVDFELIVEEVLKDDGTLAAGKPLVLRARGIRTEPIDPLDEYPLPAPGDRYLFFLRAQPDNTAYASVFGTQSRLIIDGPVVTESDGARTPVEFNGIMTPDAFIQLTKDVIAGKVPLGPTPIPTKLPLPPTPDPCAVTDPCKVEVETYPEPGTLPGPGFTEAPGPFGKGGPVNGALEPGTTAAILSWGTAERAERYEYCISANPTECPNGPVTIGGSFTNVGSSRSVKVTGLQPGTTYSWQVRAVNSIGATVADNGQSWVFTTAR